MRIIETHIGNWYLQCTPDDGGRISVLQYSGQDLLTRNPPVFMPPENYLGEYETRPVFGYDDCFPSVDLCVYPGEPQLGRDHGELCWRKWQVKAEGNSLICTVDCPGPRATFIRTLEFAENKLKWKFTVINLSSSGIHFLHVMHALMPLQDIRHVELPCFQKALDESTLMELDLKHPHELTAYLMNIKQGTWKMLVLKNPEKGMVRVSLRSGLVIAMEYQANLFPTLGIWWNNSGYPDEDGLRRVECAFEPIPGSCSNLEQSFKDGFCLSAEQGRPLSWEVNWEIYKE